MSWRVEDAVQLNWRLTNRRTATEAMSTPAVTNNNWPVLRPCSRPIVVLTGCTVGCTATAGVLTALAVTIAVGLSGAAVAETEGLLAAVLCEGYDNVTNTGS